MSTSVDKPREHEADEIIAEFARLLRPVLADGATKREPHTWQQTTVGTHVLKIARHWDRWVRGERHDADSGAHPLVHVAFRALAIAWREGRHG